MKKIFCILGLVLMVTGCSGDDELGYKDRSAEVIYKAGMEMLDETAWVGAADEFIEIERQHPYSPYAATGLYMAGYAYYKATEYEQAIQILDRFLKYHPAHEEVAYVLYLKSMCYYDQISDIKREQKATVDALKTMDELERRFPKSEYTQNVKNKMKILKNYLAAKEMFTARNLLYKDNYLAALNRFQLVLKQYSETRMVPEALYRMVEIYIALGEIEEAEKTAVILGANYPKHEWYHMAYKLVNKYKKK